MSKFIAVFSLHGIIWSSFLLIMHLAVHDHLKYRVILFFVFLYISYLMAAQIIQKKGQAFVVSVASPLTFYLGKLAFDTVLI